MNFKTIRELFYFTQKERGGIIALLCLIFILLAINIVLPYIIKSKPVDTSAWEEEVKSYLNRQENRQQQAAYKDPEPFDPNSISYIELSGMGVPDKVASNWIKYIEKGGRFKEKKDVRKIYGMTDALFDRLEGFIFIPPAAKVRPDVVKSYAGFNGRILQSKNDFNNDRSFTPVNCVELNSADSTGLENLPGIGPVLASRIIRYRNLLGGFYSVDQLHEVYGLREEHYFAASPYLNVDAEILRRFNLNFATLTELGRHPYIGFRIARKIVKLRDEKGKYSSVEDLSGIKNKLPGGNVGSRVPRQHPRQGAEGRGAGLGADLQQLSRLAQHPAEEGQGEPDQPAQDSRDLRHVPQAGARGIPGRQARQAQPGRRHQRPELRGLPFGARHPAGDVSSWQLDVVRECGTCHVNRIETYRDTFHGQVTSLGFVRVATCAACHGAHDIRPGVGSAVHGEQAEPREDLRGLPPRGIAANFASFDPHANRHDKNRDPALLLGRQVHGAAAARRVQLLRHPHRLVVLPRGRRQVLARQRQGEALMATAMGNTAGAPGAPMGSAGATQRYLPGVSRRSIGSCTRP